MSFILDALKKSESERQRQSAPALFEVKVATPRRQLPLWAIALAALLVVNLGGLAWLMMRSAPEDGARDAKSAADRTPPNAPVAGSEGMVTFTVPASVAPTIAISSGTAPEPGVIAPSSAPPLAEEPLLSAREPAIEPDYDVNDYAPAVTPAQARAADARRGGVPSRDELLARGTALPELRLDLHVYAAEPADRFVFINMRKLREGETLPEGVRVDAITPTGAMLTYRGSRFTIDGN